MWDEKKLSLCKNNIFYRNTCKQVFLLLFGTVACGKTDGGGWRKKWGMGFKGRINKIREAWHRLKWWLTQSGEPGAPPSTPHPPRPGAPPPPAPPRLTQACSCPLSSQFAWRLYQISLDKGVSNKFGNTYLTYKKNLTFDFALLRSCEDLIVFIVFPSHKKKKISRSQRNKQRNRQATIT